MKVVRIPSRGDLANYNELLSLDGKIFSFRFRYNDRDSSWYVSVYDVAGEAIRTGVKLIPNFPIVGQLVSNLWPSSGQLAVLDARKIPLPPTLAELGSVSNLFYGGDNP